MNTSDYAFICNSIAGISGIMVRHYYDNALQLCVDPADFNIDPILPFYEDILLIQKPVSYYMVNDELYFGMIRNEKHAIVIGPFFAFTPSRQTIFNWANLLELQQKERENFSQKITSCPLFPLNRGLQTIGIIHFYINHKKESLDKLISYKISNKLEQYEDNNISSNPSVHEYDSVHSTASFEQFMIDCVKQGDVERLRKFVTEVPYGNVGIVGPTPIRQLKNLFIGTTTLVSRVAVEGGLSIEKSYSLADKYIQKVEQLTETDRILNLYYNMIIYFATLVSELTLHGHNSRFLAQITNYIHENITASIRVEDLAREFNMSRTHLSARFKQETNLTISDFIINEKIKEAKHLIDFSDKTIMEISHHLSYSSQSHFSNLFRQKVGITPSQYRNQIKKTL